MLGKVSSTSRAPITCGYNLTELARAALNFKGIPYRTEWIEYPEMASKFNSFGIPATAESASGWSIPAVRLPDDSYVMDSRKIADALEALQPKPSLRLDGDHVERTQAAVIQTAQALIHIAFPRIPELLLNPSSAEYFRITREKRFGMPLTELAKSNMAGEPAWVKAEIGLRKLIRILYEHADGPFVLGKEASYPDLIVAGLWSLLKRLDQGDLFERGMSYDQTLIRHWEACQQYLVRDDH